MKYANCFEGKYLMEKRNKSSVYEPPNKKIVVIFIIVLWLIIFLIVGIGVYRLQTTYEYEPKNIVTISAQEVYYPSAALSQVEVKFSVSGHKPDKLEANIEIVDAAQAPPAERRRRVAPAIAEFLTLYPGLDVQLRLIDSFVDLRGDHLGEVDLVLRIGPLADTRLIATPLAPLVRVLCASPAYLERRGTPRSPQELVEHDGLDWDGLAPQYAWRFQVGGQRQLFRPRRQRMTTNNAETLLFGAVSGLGIAHLPTWLVSEHLLRGELIPLFCEEGLPDPEPSSIYALNLNRDIHSRTRLLLAFLRERFGEAPPWDRLLRERLAAPERNESGHFQAEF